jgi:hypothetical protein
LSAVQLVVVVDGGSGNDFLGQYFNTAHRTSVSSACGGACATNRGS